MLKSSPLTRSHELLENYIRQFAPARVELRMRLQRFPSVKTSAPWFKVKCAPGEPETV